MVTWSHAADRKKPPPSPFPPKSDAATAVSLIVINHSKPSNSGKKKLLRRSLKSLPSVPPPAFRASEAGVIGAVSPTPPFPPTPDRIVTLWQPHRSPGGGSADDSGGAGGRVISQDLCAQWKGHGFDHRQTGSASINRLHPLAAA